MSDWNPEPFDAFDTRIARTMRAYTERAITPIVASDVARAAMATDVSSGHTLRLPIVGPSRLGWAAVLFALLALAVLGGAMVTGALAPSAVHLGVVQPSASPSATDAAAPARLVFVRDNAIYVAAADGSGARRIVSGDAADAFAFGPSIRWAPAGGRFAVRTERHLVVFTDDGRSLASYPFTWQDQQFAWAPDGSEIAMLHRHGPLELLSLDGTPTRTLPLPDDFGFTYDLPGIAWSPDGNTIALAGCTRCALKAVQNQLWLDKTDGSGVTSLISTPYHYTPSWGPDGRLYFGIGEFGLGVIEPDGSGFQDLFRHSDWLEDIEPSPDGTRIAIRAGFATEVTTIDADGSQPVTAAKLGVGDIVRWSADGRLLTTNASGVIEFDPDGGNLQVLVPGATAFDIGGSR